MGGRRRVPTAVRQLKGNQRAEQRNEKEPKTAAVLCKPPPYLSPRQKTIFRRFAKQIYAMGISSDQDTAALSTLAVHWDSWVECNKVTSKQGLTYSSVSKTGETKHYRRPEVSIGIESWKHVMRVLTEFGLTPASRGKVSIIENDNGAGKPKGTRDKLAAGTGGWDEL